jgi:hypothetical protein
MKARRSEENKGREGRGSRYAVPSEEKVNAGL